MLAGMGGTITPVAAIVEGFFLLLPAGALGGSSLKRSVSIESEIECRLVGS
jgi:hypothetical protein